MVHRVKKDPPAPKSGRSHHVFNFVLLDKMLPCNKQHGGLHHHELKENKGPTNKVMAKLHEAGGRREFLSL